VRSRIAFFGTPLLGRIILASLADDPAWEVALVVAQPDKPKGRGLIRQAGPVREEASARGLPLMQPASARDPAFLDALRAVNPSVIVVAAYGQILPSTLLEIPRFGCVNVHTSILPRWRGAAPIQWAILEADPETGVTLMRMDAGLDTGDIIAMERVPILPSDTARSLHDRLAESGAQLLRRALPEWLAGRIAPIPQPAEGITYARKLTREDGRLDWTRPADELARRVRALDPWPGAFASLPDRAGRETLKIWEAEAAADQGRPGTVLRAAGSDLVVAAGRGSLRLKSVQRMGRQRLPVREFLLSGCIQTGDVFGTGAGPAENHE
jgi:methionyl-tRNA formyltransferase